jgi:hypothetical protein
MPGHNELIARGAEYLGVGVYVEDRGALVLIGNAFGRKNVIYLGGNEFAALCRWARAHGYELPPS